MTFVTNASRHNRVGCYNSLLTTKPKVQVHSSSNNRIYRHKMILLTLLSAIAILIMATFWNLNWFHISPETLQSTKLRSSSRVAVNTDIQGVYPECVDAVWTASSRKRNVNQTFANRHRFQKCNFTPIEKGGPIPVVFIVNGRSGSDATWAALSSLAGGETPIGEHTGENQVKAMDFLGRMTEEEGAWWITEHLCQFAHRHCDKPLVSFKWKPFLDSWELPAAKGMLRKLATFNEPRIKVIFMTRNPLDVMISKAKHKSTHGRLDAHCKANDVRCIKKQKEKGTGLHLPTETLLKDLTEAFDAFDVFEESLNDWNIDYIKTTYEDLYDRDDAVEWMRIFKYLGRGPTQNLTMAQVVESFTLAPTSHKHHNESLANYQEVYELLVDTEFEYLIH